MIILVIYKHLWVYYIRDGTNQSENTEIMKSYPIQCINSTQSPHLSAACQKCILVSRAGKLTPEITSVVNVERHFLPINPLLPFLSGSFQFPGFSYQDIWTCAIRFNFRVWSEAKIWRELILPGRAEVVARRSSADELIGLGVN